MAVENVGGIEYTIDANTKPLLSANKKADRSLNDIEKSFDSASSGSKKFDAALTKTAAGVRMAGKAIITASKYATIAAAALAAVVVKASSAAREIENMARLSGTTVEEFQELAFGARTVGVSAEKLGDIFKDVQDKIGDFLATGGGEMADYFEKIAPLVGQTAEEFRGLSGADALIKFKQGLDAANISAGEQVFYLESLANDVSLLAPLLSNSAQGFRDAAKQANELNVVLSEAEIKELAEVKNEFDKLFSTVGAVTSKIVADLAPSIISAIQSVINIISDAGKGIDRLFDLFQDAKNVDSIVVLEDRLKDLEASLNAISSSGSIDAVGRSANAQRQRYSELVQEIEKTKARIAELRGEATREPIRIEIQKPMGELIPDKASIPTIFDTDEGRLEDTGVSNFNAQLQAGLGISQQMASEIEMLDIKFQDLGTTINDTLIGSALTFGDTIGNAFANGIAEGESLNDILGNIGNTIATQVLSSLISLGVQYGVNAALKASADATEAASGAASLGVITAAGVASAASLASAWAPAAAAASIATAGGAATAGTAALTTTYATAEALSLAGGRVNGGAVAANSAYQVTENGKPEMLTVGGKNILMMGNQSGTVTSNSDLTGGNGGGAVYVNVVNNSSGTTVSASKSQVDSKTILDVVVADLNANGKTMQAITSGTTANYKAR